MVLPADINLSLSLVNGATEFKKERERENMFLISLGRSPVPLPLDGSGRGFCLADVNAPTAAKTARPWQSHRAGGNLRISSCEMAMAVSIDNCSRIVNAALFFQPY